MDGGDHTPQVIRARFMAEHFPFELDVAFSRAEESFAFGLRPAARHEMELRRPQPLGPALLRILDIDPGKRLIEGAYHFTSDLLHRVCGQFDPDNVTSSVHIRGYSELRSRKPESLPDLFESRDHMVRMQFFAGD